MTPTPTPEYLHRLFNDNAIVVLRHAVGSQWQSGWFDDPDALLATARSLAKTGNLYTTLNPLSLRPVRNCMGNRHAGDDDAVRYSRMLFDFDPVRPANTSSTQTELDAAIERADGLAQYLHALGWPAPAKAISGNGAHLQYRVALPNDDETKKCLQRIYQGLAADFSDDMIEFDQVVRNPGRIVCLYGALKRKGTPTADRPHRQSKIWLPDRWQQVSQGTVKALAAFYEKSRPKKPSPRIKDFSTRFSGGSGDYRSLNIVAWFDAHGLYLQPGTKPGVHFVVCPWEHEHSDGYGAQTGDTVIFEGGDGGWPGFFCHHSHCDGRRIRDVMALFKDADAFCTGSWRANR